MKQALDIQDFSIVLAARNHNPTIINPEFLRGSGVVPGEWELARSPAVSSQSAQIIFRKGMGLNPRRFVTLGDRPDQAHLFITETILSRGSWQDFSTY